jgi:hypothetical protein
MTIETHLESYPELLQELKSLLIKTKYQAYKAVDNLRVQTYWQIGERIVREELQHQERADYGEYLLNNLAKDLGFLKRDLYRMVQFYRTYPIMTSLMSQLSWTHYVVLITLSNNYEREFYELRVAQEGWSVRTLQQEIKNKLYARSTKKGTLISTKKLPLKLLELNNVFKDTYNFEFLDLKGEYSEKELN